MSTILLIILLAILIYTGILPAIVMFAAAVITWAAVAVFGICAVLFVMLVAVIVSLFNKIFASFRKPQENIKE